MRSVALLTGEGVSCSGQSPCPASVALPQRDPSVTPHDLIELYIARYAGKDPSRGQRPRWWQEQLGSLTLAHLNGESDRINLASRKLSERHGLFRAGIDAATDRTVYRAKKKPIAHATLNRYATALGAVPSWAKDELVTPRGSVSPTSEVKLKPEVNGVVRFLDERERTGLLDAKAR